MTTALIGYDTELAFASVLAPTTFVALAEVFEVTPPSFTVDQVEATHMASPDRTREYIPTLTDPGTASAVMNFVPGSATDTLILGLRTSGATVPMRITYPNNETVTFDGFIAAYTPNVPLDDRMTAEVQIKVTGAVVVS